MRTGPGRVENRRDGHSYRVILDLNLDADHPSGWLRLEPEGPTRHFDGYVQPIRAL
jgi:hypothetical protein